MQRRSYSQGDAKLLKIITHPPTAWLNQNKKPGSSPGFLFWREQINFAALLDHLVPGT